MTTAADFINALGPKRTQLTLRPCVPGELPTGWQRWLDDMPVVDVQAAGAKPQPWVDVFLQRPLRAIPRSPPFLGNLQAAMRLLRQEWDADPRDERALRIGVGALDVLLHLVLVALLVWLVYMGLTARDPPRDEGEVVQVHFIGRGSISEGGGEIANAGAESAPVAAAPATRANTPAPATGRPDATPPSPSPPQVAASQATPPSDAEPVPAAPAEAAQLLQVSEVPVPQAEAFQLPPPKPLALPQPRLQVRDVPLRERVEEVPTLRPQAQRILQAREIAAEVQVPRLREAPRALEVPAPQALALPQPRALPSPTTPTAQVQVPQLRGEVREIPMPPGGAPQTSPQAGSGTAAQAATPAAGAGGERGSAVASGQAPASTGQGARPAEQGARGVAAIGSGAGPARPAPGGWPGPARSDDWGASKRNVAGTGTGSGKEAGSKPGLFNPDGSPRLGDEWTRQSGIDLDRAGTWLTRPGLEYRGTRFDRYWVPNGTLLEEWVRKGIKQVAIPIPGTRRQLRCVVSMLPPGAICAPYSPDVNEQPARARPPPDIPFKPELQEDNGSERPRP